MFIGKSRRFNMLATAFTVVIVFLTASCGSAESVQTNIVEQYYSAIENEDANSAASLFTDDAVIVTPSGNIVNGIDAIKEQFIPYDLQFMDRVDFLTGFTESEGKLLWTQEWHHIEGDSFTNDCEVTLENGQIVEWLFQ